jgi:hypothetical protein
MNFNGGIALFAGNDISTNLLLNALVPELLHIGYQPRMYLPSHRTAARIALPELQELAFFERVIPSRVLYPYLDGTPAIGPVQFRSPLQIAAKYGIAFANVDNINSPEFIRELTDSDVQAGVSIRCYQKFGPEFIGFFNGNAGKRLWNLHPGILPQYRGVMTFFWSMLDSQRLV